MKDSLALYLSLRVCETKQRRVVRLHTRLYGTSNTATLRIHSDEPKNLILIKINSNNIIINYYLLQRRCNGGNSNSFDYSLLKKITPLVTPLFPSLHISVASWIQMGSTAYYHFNRAVKLWSSSHCQRCAGRETPVGVVQLFSCAARFKQVVPFLITWLLVFVSHATVKPRRLEDTCYSCVNEYKEILIAHSFGWNSTDTKQGLIFLVHLCRELM